MVRIVLDNVSVGFPIYTGSNRSLRHIVMKATTGGRIGADASGRVYVEALSGISCVMERGDRVALIGHNGAGKTTLLRVLAGIYEPVIGRVKIEGTVAPLFDVNLGMSPDATGYENIRIRALYLGMSDRELAEKLDDIAEFTELGDFLNMPLRTYSMGMHARLAFAISTAINPEILLVDEGIGAGDAAFIDKANARLADFIDRSGILVLSTHAVDLMNRLCNKAIVMEKGRIIFTGDVAEALEFYRQPRTPV